MRGVIGLRRHTVRVVPHHAEWSALGARECETVRRTGGDLVLDAQHVGSTSVPGLPAKPILDLAVAVRSASSIPALIPRLVAAGYLDRGDKGEAGGHLLVREPEPDVRTVHTHVVARDDAQWRDYLRFRDALRSDTRLRSAYAELKADLAARFPRSRRSYTSRKDVFVRRFLDEGRERWTSS
jgi:GrpB-like predicted nucleotidyltransferase (UPF0157 family)